MTTPREANWEAPGPGSWICDRSHATPAPTPVYRRIISEHTEPAYRRVMEDFGAGIGSLDMQIVNGALYRRLVPLIAPDKDKGKVPPNAVLWLATRLHPEFRRREKIATRVMREKSFLAGIRHWIETERYEWITINRGLQQIEPADLDNGALADHLAHLDERLVAGWLRHHQLHGNDLGPIGDLLAHAQDWHLDPGAVMSLLRGASPATTDAARHGTTIAEALRDGGVDPTTITTVDQIRAVPAASEALEEYLDTFGWRLISDYDIAGLTLVELPSAIVAIVRRGAKPNLTDESDDETREEVEKLRARCPDPALFDELLASAREAYGIRDDNGPLTWAWPAGLTRRAYLEAARRLHAQDWLIAPEHVFEMDIPELVALLRADSAPEGLGPDDLAQRADHRAWEATLQAPDTLGPPPPDPDISPLPPGLRRLMAVILAAVTMIDPDVDRTLVPLTGLGIGDDRYVGTARVADDPGTAIAEMQPGDVLVAPWTAPSFNAVFSIAGGVVVQEGGLLCHAAVMARELHIPAVIGCVDAMSEIKSGDLIEIDPIAGTVRVLESANAGV